MNDQLLFFLVLWPLLSTCGLALIHLGLSGLRKARRQADRERSFATGTVVELIPHTTWRRGQYRFWHPVVEFTADGRTLRQESSAGCQANQLEVGERVDIRYCAGDPASFHLEKLRVWEERGDRITVLAGGIWVAAASVIAVLAALQAI